MSWISRTISALSPNCKQAIRMQSDALDQPLSFSQRAGLCVHLWLCKWCRRYGRQIEFLRTAARDDDHVHAHVPEKALPPEARERIEQALKSVRTSPD